MTHTLTTSGLLTRLYRLPVPRSLDLVREYCLKGRDLNAERSAGQRGESDDVFDDIQAFVQRN